MKRVAVIVLACVLVVMGAVVIRAVWAGGAALDEGDAALQQGDTAGAIAAWRRAARWYVPVVGATGDALERLERLATDAEARKDVATAQAAWLAVRTATVAIRGATAPFDEARVRADAHLAALLAAEPNPGAGASAADRTAYHARVLAATARPTRGWLVLAAAGLVLVLVGAGVVSERRQRGLVMLGAGVVVWFAGMLLA